MLAEAGRANFSAVELGWTHILMPDEKGNKIACPLQE
jgi:hypothetical protein